jgi:hypothetical protein
MDTNQKPKPFNHKGHEGTRRRSGGPAKLHSKE